MYSKKACVQINNYYYEEPKDRFSEWKGYHLIKQNKLFWYRKDGFFKGKRRHFGEQNKLFCYE
jgi:hypothetical protein